MKHIAALIALVAIASAPVAHSQSAFCAQALRDINLGLKMAEVDSWNDAIDNSAPRSNLRQAQALVAAQRAHINLDLMRDAKCRMPTTVYSTAPYAEFMNRCIDASDEKKNGAMGSAIKVCAGKLLEAPDAFK